MVAAYILENTEELFLDSTFYGIYRDDGLNVLEGLTTTDDMCDWLDDSQTRVNKLTGIEHLQFTTDI